MDAGLDFLKNSGKVGYLKKMYTAIIPAQSAPGSVLMALLRPPPTDGAVNAITLFVLIIYAPLGISCRVFSVFFRHLVKYYL